MKRDLDRLMEAHHLDAILVSGHVSGNAPLYYLVNGVPLTRAKVVKRLGEEPHLIVSPMERELAEVVGYPIILETRYGYRELLQEHGGDLLAAAVAYYHRIFDDLGVKGRVGCYGLHDQGASYVLLKALDENLPDVEIVGELGTTLMDEVRATKSADEVARIRAVGRRTVEIVRRVVDFLRAHTVGDDETLRRADGAVLTVDDVHRYIRHLLAQQGLIAPIGFIFSTGRDAGIPHNQGTLEAPIRLGESIVFDIYPCESDGGYFFDMTRTFCLGYAPEAVRRIHRDVLDALRYVQACLAAGEPARRYQQMTSDFLRARGHPTTADDPQTLRGYVHTLGHGLGLDIHEAPFFSDTPDNTTILKPGHVFTTEPGLYYPDEGYGCRLEDVIWIDEEGTVHNLTDYPYDLVIPMD